MKHVVALIFRGVLGFVVNFLENQKLFHLNLWVFKWMGVYCLGVANVGFLKH